MNGTLKVMYGSALNPGAPSIFMDPRGKSDFDAGLLLFGVLARMYPGLTWSQLAQQPQIMAGWWTDLKHTVGDIKDGVGDVISDTIGLASRKGGETVRLASDPNVADTVSRAATAYATGGQSEGAKGIFDAIGQIFTPTGREVVEKTGAAYKASVGGIGDVSFKNPLVWGGLGLAAALYLALRPRPVYYRR